MKNWTIGAISGGITGLIGALLVIEFNFSLLLVVIIGALVGFGIGLLNKLILKKRKNKS